MCLNTNNLCLNANNDISEPLDLEISLGGGGHAPDPP